MAMSGWCCWLCSPKMGMVGGRWYCRCRHCCYVWLMEMENDLFSILIFDAGFVPFQLGQQTAIKICVVNSVTNCWSVFCTTACLQQIELGTGWGWCSTSIWKEWPRPCCAGKGERMRKWFCFNFEVRTISGWTIAKCFIRAFDGEEFSTEISTGW